MIKYTQAFFASLFLFSSCVFGVKDPARVFLDIDVKVVDENNAPVPDAQVTFFFHHTHIQEIDLGHSVKVIQSEYDGENPVSASYAATQTVGVRVEKEGFWTSSIGYQVLEKDRTDGGTEDNGEYRKFFTVILRRKENPRALEVQRLKWTTVPGFDEAYGFDLERSDWISPHGQGKITDMLFTFSGERVSEEEFSMKMEIVFPGEGNGLIEVPVSALSRSNLLLGQTAPLEGYDPLFVDYFSNEFVNRILRPLSRRTQQEWAAIEGYWFRIRAEEDANAEDGIKARYGKIEGQIKWSGRPEQLPRFSFTYYLAPDHSLSLEWNGESLIPGADLQGVRKR